MTRVSNLYNRRCSSTPSNTQRTAHAVVKILVVFFFSIWFQNEEIPLKKVLSALLEGTNGFKKSPTLFQRKLNEHPEEVSFTSKFCLTVQIQYFEVSIFVGFKCQFPF